MGNLDITFRLYLFYQHEHFQLETHYFREISLQVDSWVGIHQVRNSTILVFDWELGFKFELFPHKHLFYII